MENLIETEHKERVLLIRLNRPEKRNAITAAMYQTLADILEEAAGNSKIRAVVLTGAGDCFTSGNDLHDFLNHGLTGGNMQDRPVIRFLRRIATFPKPLIAAVNGAAVGIGVTMLLHCDLVYAVADAALQLPFVDLALVPEAASSLLLPKLAGHHKAAELFMLGAAFSARDAVALGLVNDICPDAALIAQVLQTAQNLAGKPPEALMRTKALMKADQTAVLKAIETESRVFAEQLQSPEAREAIQAFLEKRAPDFSRF